jgi:hypothetical protein
MGRGDAQRLVLASECAKNPEHSTLNEHDGRFGFMAL